MASSPPSTQAQFGEHAYDEQGNYIGPDVPAGEEAPAGEAGAETPGAEPSDAETPGAEQPLGAERVRGRDAPVDETPAVETPAVETPAVETEVQAEARGLSDTGGSPRRSSAGRGRRRGRGTTGAQTGRSSPQGLPVAGRSREVGAGDPISGATVGNRRTLDRGQPRSCWPQQQAFSSTSTSRTWTPAPRRTWRRSSNSTS